MKYNKDNCVFCSVKSRPKHISTKENIIRSAYECANANRYDVEFRTAEVAEMSGVTMAMVNYYFGNREGLKKEVVYYRYRLLLEKLELMYQSSKKSPPNIRLKEYLNLLITEFLSISFVAKLHAEQKENDICFEMLFRATAIHFSEMIINGVIQGVFYHTPRGEDVALLVLGAVKTAGEQVKLLQQDSQADEVNWDMVTEQVKTNLMVNVFLFVGFRE